MAGLFLLDTFTATSGTFLDGHTSNEIGTATGWTMVTGTGSLKINSSGRVYRDGSGNAAYRANGNPAGPNQHMRARVYIASTIGNAALRLRHAGSGAHTCYQAVVNRAGGVLRLQRVVTGTATTLGSDYAYTPPAGTGFRIDFSAVDNADGVSVDLTLKLDDTTVLTYNDASASRLTTAGFVALHITEGSATTGVQFDRVEAWDVGATIPTTAPALVAPADAGTLNRPDDIEWGSVTNATTYRVELGEDSAFNGRPTQITTASLTQEILYQVAQDTSYHWRVRAENADGVGPWSATRTFTTDAPPITASILNGGAHVWDSSAFGLQSNFFTSVRSFERRGATAPAWVPVGHEAIGVTSTEHGNNHGETEKTVIFSFSGDPLAPDFEVVDPNILEETPDLLYNPADTNGRPWYLTSAPDGSQPTALRTSATLAAGTFTVNDSSYIPLSGVPGDAADMTAYARFFPEIAGDGTVQLSSIWNEGGAAAEYRRHTASGTNLATVTTGAVIDQTSMMPSGYKTAVGGGHVWINGELWLITTRSPDDTQGGGASPGRYVGIIRCAGNDPYTFQAPFYDLWEPDGVTYPDDLKGFAIYIRDSDVSGGKARLYLLVGIKHGTTDYRTYALDAGYAVDPVSGAELSVSIRWGAFTGGYQEGPTVVGYSMGRRLIADVVNPNGGTVTKTWASSNASVVYVHPVVGTAIGVAESGSATITVTANNGTEEATGTITVTAVPQYWEARGLIALASMGAEL